MEERFWSFVEVGALDECWNWTASKQGGYGQIGDDMGLRPVRAHRLSYEIHHGPIPAGMMVCHHCDNRACVNPAHLFIGTQLDNMRDMQRKGRGPRGERHGRHRLTESQVVQIRGDARPQREIADDYGITQTAVSAIKRRKSWAWLDEDAS